VRRKPLNPNSMQLIMENFKRYTEQTSDYGPLCLFEDGISKEVSFYDHIHQLNESDESIELFLENWEKSADYFLAQLNEADPAQQSQWQLLKQNPVLFLSTQAWVNLDRFKDKAAAAVSRVLSKIGAGLESLKTKSPKLYKFGVGSLKGLAWMTAGILVYKIIQSGGNIEGLDQVATTVENVAPDAGQAIENISQAANVEQGMEALQTFDAEARQALEALPGLGDQIGAPEGSAIDGANDAITQAVETYPDSPPQDEALDWFSDMLEEKAIDKGTENVAGPLRDPKSPLTQAMEKILGKKELDTLSKQVEDGNFDRPGRKMLRHLYKELPPNEASDLKAVVKINRIARAEDIAINTSNKLVTHAYNKTPAGRLMQYIDKISGTPGKTLEDFLR